VLPVKDKLCNSEELLCLSGRGRYELNKGVIYEMAPAGEEHGFLVANICAILHRFVKRHRSGIITGAETGYMLSKNPDTVKAPDVAFKSNERLSQGGMAKGYSSVIPDLIVEVNSPSDSHSMVVRKVKLWLSAGAKQVWVVDPEDKSVILYFPSGQSRILDKTDELDGADILPGFKCEVKEFFE